MNRASPLLAACLLVLASDGRAEPIPLALATNAGDSFALRLSSVTDARAASGGTEGRASEESVRLTYEALVTVLEVDADGRPTRERHDDVRLGYERPEGSGSLFRPGSSFEVRRARSGVEILAGERRIDRKIEKLVGDLLARRLESSLLLRLLDPGRAVEVGESWALDPGLARKVLAEHGLRAIDLGSPPTARLERGARPEDGFVLHYRIPVAWVELDRMPDDTRAGRSEALLEGRIRLGAESGDRAHELLASLAMNGAIVKSGVARAVPWSLDRSVQVTQRSQRVERVAASHGP